METNEIWNAFMSTHCVACDGAKRPRNAFCKLCYQQLPARLKNALWQRFGSGFEQAYMGCLSWFREHPLQGDHRAKQKALFSDAT